jgi:hypothetical protein
MLPPEVVGIGPVGAGIELGVGTTFVIDGLQNECGFLSGVPGVYCEVECSV